MEPIKLSTVASSLSDENIFVRVTELVNKYNPLNFGTGFPGSKEFVPQLLHEALIATQSPDAPNANDQYPRSQGHPALVKELANLYNKILNRQIDAENEVLVTLGADESLFCVMQAVLSPGEEVIIFAPSYPPYRESVLCCGAVPKFVTLKLKPHSQSADDFCFDQEELSQAFTSRTKAIIVNSPHNPTGKVYTEGEMRFIADLCKKHNCLYISDEVYHPLQYGEKMLHPATLPGMWERTVTVGSAGKFFCVTGWKTGWSIGPSYLINAALKIHTNIAYCVPTPLQMALSEMIKDELEKRGSEESYWFSLADTLKKKRDRMFKMLSDAGLNPLLPSAGYFMLCDLGRLQFEIDDDSSAKEFDERFMKWLIVKKGVVAVPVSCFYPKEDKFDKFVRFCFIKGDADFDALEKRIGPSNN